MVAASLEALVRPDGPKEGEDMQWQETMEELSQSGGVGMHQMYDAINDLRKREKKGRP